MFDGIPLRRRAVITIAAAALLVLPSLAQAQTQSLSTYGGRVGFSSDPDQLILGGWGTVAEFSPNLSFRPSGDLGVGNSVLTLIGNADIQYTFATVARGPVPFFGGGIGLLWYDPDGGESNTELGLQVYGGVELRYQGYQTGVFELRLGLDDAMPDLKLTYGFGFY